MKTEMERPEPITTWPDYCFQVDFSLCLCDTGNAPEAESDAVVHHLQHDLCAELPRVQVSRDSHGLLKRFCVYPESADGSLRTIFRPVLAALTPGRPNTDAIARTAFGSLSLSA